MCGIAGFFGLPLDDAGAQALVARMGERIRHRGPDGDGATAKDGVALAMVRLAIVDVEHGKQPMLTDDGAIALVFNGEIYNAPALRKELEREGVRFHTRSDTEVILRLYERNPDDVERHLRGMWAFAVHDRRRKRLVLSRDRFGIKPLYVCDRGVAVAFGSELRALEPVRAFDVFAPAFSIDHGSAHAMLSWAYIPNEETIYEGVKKLAPSTRLEIDLVSGARKTTRYYRVGHSDDAARVRSLDEACELVEPLLRAAVREHLESDVPVAAFLSGGIDSSLVLAYAAEQSDRPIRAFTIGFKEKRFDESPFARAVARKLGVDLHVELFDEDMARASLEEAMAAYDEPFGDSSSLATYLLSKVVARTHKVALGGDGGDEVFAGYAKHKIVRMREAVARVPRLRELGARALMALPARTDRSSAYTDALRVARKVARGLQGDDAHAYVALTQVASLQKTAQLVVRPADPARFEGPLLRAFEEAGGSQLRRTLTVDLANSLPNDMLTKVDRASMARHLEARVPFLDHRLVEAGLSLPAEFTLFGGGKRVTKALYERRFGRELARRKKMGFGVPVERWMRGPLAALINRLSPQQQPLGESRQIYFDVAAGWRRDPQIMWHLFSAELWLTASRSKLADARRG